MKLFHREYGQPDQQPLLLLHGLLGSLVNWHSVARHLEAGWRVIVPDLRNHGRSPHAGDMTYPIMAADVLELMDDLSIDQARIVGHSMGGKVAMWAALTAPSRVQALVSVDIAPVSYPMRFQPILEALLSLDLEQIRSRTQADEMLAPLLPEKMMRDYLLQNLVREGEAYSWRNNLPALHNNMQAITEFPATSGLNYAGDSLFLFGKESRYVRPEYHQAIQALFPRAQIDGIQGAGHWVYHEKQAEFLQALNEFLANT